MSPLSLTLSLLGYALILLSGFGPALTSAAWVGLTLNIISAAWSVWSKASASALPHHKRAGWSFVLSGIICAAALIGLIHSERALWALAATATLALLAPIWLTSARAATSPALSQRRQREAMLLGLSLSACVVGLWLSHQHTHVWDLTYAKTSTLSDATARTLTTLQAPLTARLYSPPNSQLRLAVEPYLASMKQASPKVHLEVLDQAQSPKLASQLGVAQNGVLTLTLADPALPSGAQRLMTRQIMLGEDRHDVRAALANLDEQVLGALRELERGERVVYLLDAPGALSGQSLAQRERASVFYKVTTEIIRAHQRRLPVDDLARAGVPSDADVLVIAGLKTALSSEAIDALERYLARGGALLLSVDPITPGLSAGDEAPWQPSLEPLLRTVGVKLESGALASLSHNAPLTRSRADRLNLLHDEFSAHPITLGLRQSEGRMALLTMLAGALAVEDAAVASPAILSPAQTWLELDGDLERGPQEREQRWPVVVASAQTGDVARGWRAIIVADGQAFNDELMGRSPGNQQLLQDSLLWLLRSTSSMGLSQDERDVRLNLRVGSPVAWRWAALLTMPALLLLVALGLRIKRRRVD